MMIRTELDMLMRRCLVRATLCLAVCLLSAPPVEAQRLYIPVRGVNAHLYSGSLVNSVVQMHLNWVRLDIVWSSIEPSRGVWSWSDTDRAVEAARSRGIQVLGNLFSTPPWACPSFKRPGTNCVPEDIERWQDFVRAVAIRYGGAIQAYGIWNEPDLKTFWLGDAVAYVDRLLVPAGQILRQYAPTALIVAPELSGFRSPATPAYAFFDAITNRGASGYVDIVGQHVYEGGSTFPCSGFSGPDGILHRFFEGNACEHSLLYQIDRGALAGRQVWITETGFVDGGWAGNGEWVGRLFDVFGPRTRVTGFFDYELIDNGDSSRGLLTASGDFKNGAYRLAAGIGYDSWNPDPPLVADGFDYPWSGSFFRWSFPSGGQDLSAAALANSVKSFAGKVNDVTADDFELSTTVQMTDDLGWEWNWVGLLGRTTNEWDTFQQSGYLGFIRSNGRVDLWSPATGTLAFAQTSVNPKAGPVRLKLRCVGTTISLIVNEVTVLTVTDTTYTGGHFGVQNYALARHDEFTASRAW